MATAPTAEDSARRILSIFAGMNQRVGESLRFSHVSMTFQKGQYRAADFKAGADYAHDHEWLSFDNKGFVTLLEKGFAEM
jgi:hypothetical protein